MDFAVRPNRLQERFLEQRTVDRVGGPFIPTRLGLGELRGKCQNPLFSGSDIRAL